jgi:putative transposase
VARWRGAIADGLSAERAVGVPRVTLYRWERMPEPLSRRPKRPRQPKWPPALIEAVEALRADNPMWGKRKIAKLLERGGLAASVPTVGRILGRLVARGASRRPEGRRIRLTQRQRYAQRLAEGHKAKKPGELVQIDTLFVNLRPDRPLKHFTACDPVAKWTLGHVAADATANAAKTLRDKLIATAPFEVKGIQVDGGSEFMFIFEDHCQENGLELVVLPRKHPDLNGCVERAPSSWRYEFYATCDLPSRIDKLQPLIDAFAYRYNLHRPHQPTSLRQSISAPSVRRPNRLICPELAHAIDNVGWSPYICSSKFGRTTLVTSENVCSF